MSVSFLQPTRQPPAAAAEPRAEADTRREAPVRVMLLNDDYTPAEYVVRVLQEELGLGGLKATWVMLKAHVAGRSLVGVYPRAEAEAKVQAAMQRARADGWPLLLSVEEGE
jgi:ATP-dependent Clp protease adaptor protein ClpS